MDRIGIAVIGRSGQLARAMERAAGGRSIRLVMAGRPDVDLQSLESLARYFNSARPDIIVNAAGYTAVDKAEEEPDEAFRVNAGGPALLATLAQSLGVPLVHISSDYVFDGTKATPYVEDDPVRPLSVYGASKAAGETAVRSGLAEHLILRTSWVYSAHGHNFVRTMLRLGAQREEVSVVDDQWGSPTSADELARAILDLAPRLTAQGGELTWGTYHLTGSGSTTWHGFAAAIFELAARAGLRTPKLKAISSADFPAAARRPAYSVLDNAKIERELGIVRRSWEESLAQTVAEIAATPSEGGPP